MRKMTTQRIEPRDGNLAAPATKEVDMERYRVELIVGRAPQQVYRVTYRLHKRGAFRVRVVALGACPWIKRVKMRGRSYLFVCFLPKEWDGERVTRRVTLLSR